MYKNSPQFRLKFFPVIRKVLLRVGTGWALKYEFTLDSGVNTTWVMTTTSMLEVLDVAPEPKDMLEFSIPRLTTKPKTSSK